MNLKLFLCLFLSISIFSQVALSEQVEQNSLAKVNHYLENILFFDVSFGVFNTTVLDSSGQVVVDSQGNLTIKKVQLPLVVVLLFFGGIFYTVYLKFINIRGFVHALKVIAGKYDRADEPGDVTHFKALTSALSATIGLGNIAGVAIAIQVGGPGAAVWMIIAAFFGMTSKFVCCTLSQMYRKFNPDGTISGGPMYYLEFGLKEKGLIYGKIGKILAVFYALFICFASFGGGCMFQVNQTVESLQTSFGLGDSYKLWIGLIIAVLVGMVIIGGIKRIGEATSKIVPLMCGIYISGCLFVIIYNYQNFLPSILLMLKLAFLENSIFGGLVGVLIIGVQRASFSNEAGLGSAAIVHAAAKTKEPIREGLVGLLEPFVDTIMVCFMTAMVVVITGVWEHPELIQQGSNLGVSLTAAAFATVIPWFPYVLTICVFLFAFSTMISWSYYGERGWIYLLDHWNRGYSTLFIYRIIFIFFIVYGAIRSLNDVIVFTDIVFLSLAIPNILGGMMLISKVKQALKLYTKTYF